jgi:hypothetical protein
VLVRQSAVAGFVAVDVVELALLRAVHRLAAAYAGLAVAHGGAELLGELAVPVVVAAGCGGSGWPLPGWPRRWHGPIVRVFSSV